MAQFVNIEAPSRIHLGLLDCGHATMRQYGGIGATIDGLHTKISATPAEQWQVTFGERLRASSRTVDDVHALVERLQDQSPPTDIRIESAAPEHMGFGSKTTLLLSTSAAAFRANNLPVDRRQLTKLSGRGGASGIGVTAFWQGGFIADGGHKAEAADRSFLPSSGRTPTDVPPVLSRMDMPSTWRVRLFHDPSSPLTEGAEERNAFRAAMPINDIQCLTALAVAYHGILPAIAEEDIVALARSLKQFNAVGMKAVEVARQSETTRQCLAALWSDGVAAGLSSMGPCVFAVLRDADGSSTCVQDAIDRHGLLDIGTFQFRNTGAAFSQSHA